MIREPARQPVMHWAGQRCSQVHQPAAGRPDWLAPQAARYLVAEGGTSARPAVDSNRKLQIMCGSAGVCCRWTCCWLSACAGDKGPQTAGKCFLEAGLLTDIAPVQPCSA